MTSAARLTRRSAYVTVDEGVRLHYVTAGRGPLVVLLHGFPAFSLMWEAHIDALAEAGFCAVAPDLRGYGRSDKPRPVAAYELRVLARDVARLIATLSQPGLPDDDAPRPFTHASARAPADGSAPPPDDGSARAAAIVGHDWGGVIAWAVAMRYPAALNKLAVINAPHPGTFASFALRHPDQMRRSTYMGFFQLPWLPEAVLRARDFALIRRELGDARYVQELQRQRALTSALNYYRALWRGGLPALRAMQRPIATHTLVIWGDRDRYLKRELAEPDRRLVPNARVIHLPDNGHWVPLEAPARVVKALIDFLYPG